MRKNTQSIKFKYFKHVQEEHFTTNESLALHGEYNELLHEANVKLRQYISLEPGICVP